MSNKLIYILSTSITKKYLIYLCIYHICSAYIRTNHKNVWDFFVLGLSSDEQTLSTSYEINGIRIASVI